MANLPPYMIRVSARARRMTIKVSAQDGVVVVVPQGYNLGLIAPFIEKNQTWIQQATLRVPRPQSTTLPEVLDLPAVGKQWQVNYEPGPSRHCKVFAAPGTLWLQGAVEDRRACITALKAWLAEQGHLHLVPWLTTLSKSTGLPFAQVSIKNQKTRWGSCSRAKNINLNYQLLFLPAHLVDYVLVHELCHTLVLNHSPRFWDLVGQHSPHYLQHKQQLQRSLALIPGWLRE